CGDVFIAYYCTYRIRCYSMEILILLVVVVVLLFAVPDIRRSLITRPAFDFFKRVLPPLSPTEREAMQAGDTWWDADLFSGRPDWHKFHQIKAPQFSEEERSEEHT